MISSYVAKMLICNQSIYMKLKSHNKTEIIWTKNWDKQQHWDICLSHFTSGMWTKWRITYVITTTPLLYVYKCSTVGESAVVSVRTLLFNTPNLVSGTFFNNFVACMCMLLTYFVVASMLCNGTTHVSKLTFHCA